jgi:hypothetical protein
MDDPFASFCARNERRIVVAEATARAQLSARAVPPFAFRVARVGTIIDRGVFRHDVTIDHHCATSLRLAVRPPLIAVLGAAALATAPPFAVHALAAEDPVRIISCSTTTIPSFRGRGENARFRMTVSYAVVGEQADLVRFVTRTPSGDVRTYTDRGRFSPGVTIAHDELIADASDAPEERAGAPTACAAAYVHFVNGTAWSAAQQRSPGT